MSMNNDLKYKDALGQAMLPFVMRELVAMVMKRKALPLEDALFYIYSSRLYRSLQDEKTKSWYQSTISLYEDLEREKAAAKRGQNEDPKVLLFQMFCAENYREAKKMSAEDVLMIFSLHDVFGFLSDNYDMLHTQDADYMIDTITTYIRRKR